MPKLTGNRVPSYRLHKQSGNAIVTLNGRDVLLGKWNTAASRAEYQRLVGEWLAGGRQSPRSASDLTIVELIKAFKEHCRTYYVGADGKPTGEADNIAYAMRQLRQLYGSTLAVEFGPLRFKALRDLVIQPRREKRKDGTTITRPGWCRTNANMNMARVKMLFRWAAEMEMLPANIYHALQAVPGLKQGRSLAREPEPVKPVPDEFVIATKRFLSTTVAAMVDLQLVTVARPGEIVVMRGVDIDTTGTIWMYSPSRHKTQHRGHVRKIMMGPKAQALVKPFLKLDPSAPLFNPADAAAERRQLRSQSRKTPLNQGNKPGSKVTKDPARPPGEAYDVSAYRRAISRAADRANSWAKGGYICDNDERLIPRWFPHQLRHSAATNLRKEFGIEAAQVILGHRTLSVTEIYAEQNVEAAMKIMSKVG